MGRPVGSRNKEKFAKELAESGVATLERPTTRDKFDLVLGMRRLHTGPFAGMWELTKLVIDPKDVKSLEVLTDANLKRFVIGRAQIELTRCNPSA